MRHVLLVHVYGVYVYGVCANGCVCVCVCVCVWWLWSCAGSGGLGCAKRAAGYGASVAIIEGNRYGGTCVNVGCVPKKVMYNASHVMESIEDAKHFG
jgi:hypothetical protein